jgi:phosphoadenosine phosphosulfate reductase
MKIDEINEMILGKGIDEQLRMVTYLFRDKVVFTTSFGIEDQVITHVIFRNDIQLSVVTLDTGRLFNETYKVYNETLKKYGKPITVYFPESRDVEKLVNEKGPFSFYHSKENRLECCRIRKVLPLNRALDGMEVWISGIRSEQSPNRSSMKMFEWDEERRLFKFYPLFDWTYQMVKSYITMHDIPVNSLSSRGFLSIGCEPCTRAVRPGGDFRSGRWWWENGSEKECGCHIKNLK